MEWKNTVLLNRTICTLFLLSVSLFFLFFFSLCFVTQGPHICVFLSDCASFFFSILLLLFFNFYLIFFCFSLLSILTCPYKVSYIDSHVNSFHVHESYFLFLYSSFLPLPLHWRNVNFRIREIWSLAKTLLFQVSVFSLLFSPSYL